MNRRRALLAASAASGGGGGKEPFYAELFFDYCESLLGGGVYCERAADALSLECYEIGKALVEKYGEDDGIVNILTNPLDYGFEVYIEGVLSTKISMEYGALFFFSETEYMGGINPDGTLIKEY